MNIAGRSILLAPLLACLLSGNATASTSGAPDNLSNSPLATQQPDNRFNSLFTQQAEELESLTVRDSLSSIRVATGKPKEPFKAFVYAVVPGVIAHGAGHFYAGKTTTGFLLLGTELAGAALVLGGTSTGWGRSSPTREGFAVALAGGTLFFGSWIYDMIKSPLIVEKQNRLLEKNSVGIEFGIQDREPRLAAVWRF